MVYMQIPFVIIPKIALRSEGHDAYQDNTLRYRVNMGILLHLRLGWSGLARSRWIVQKRVFVDSKSFQSSIDKLSPSDISV